MLLAGRQRPNVAFGAWDAPNVAFGASDAPNATLGRSLPDSETQLAPRKLATLVGNLPAPQCGLRCVRRTEGHLGCVIRNQGHIGALGTEPDASRETRARMR